MLLQIMIHLRAEKLEQSIHLEENSEFIRYETDNISIISEEEKNTKQSRIATNTLLRDIVKKQWETENPLFKIISIETRSHCNLDCDFCPVNKHDDPRPPGLMPKETIIKIAEELKNLKYKDTILLFGNNEPLLDDRIVDIVAIFRSHCPQSFIKILTNGTLMTVDLAESLFQAGLSTLTINNYTDGVKLIKPVEDILTNAEKFKDDDIRISVRRSNQVLTNRAGLAPNKSPLTQPLNQFCALPFVDLTITFEGKVVLCCFDATGKTDFGNVNSSSLIDIWQNSKFSDVRRSLLARNRNCTSLCSVCDYDGFRDPYQSSDPSRSQDKIPARKWIMNSYTKYQKNVITQTAAHVKKTLTSDTTGHNWWHVLRVWKTSLYIGTQENNVDLFVVQLAALLHDISDYKLNGGDETLGPKVAKKWLDDLGVDEHTVEHVCEIISHMNYQGANVISNMKTVEGKIVQDADRLDAIGAIGISRTFAYGGYRGQQIYDPEAHPVLHMSFEEYKQKNTTSINHFYEKLLLLKDLLHTKVAIQIAEKRHNFMELFLKQFFEEWDSKDLLEIDNLDN